METPTDRLPRQCYIPTKRVFPDPPALLLQGVARVNGPACSEQRLPNTLSIGIKGLRASELLCSLQDELAASAGAACHSSQQATVSAVLQAMQVCICHGFNSHFRFYCTRILLLVLPSPVDVGVSPVLCITQCFLLLIGWHVSCSCRVVVWRPSWNFLPHSGKGRYNRLLE